MINTKLVIRINVILMKEKVKNTAYRWQKMVRKTIVIFNFVIVRHIQIALSTKQKPR